MRLWTLHPKWLDTKGLGAVWKEGLLARDVLLGKTRGYKNHPQLDRFKALPDPVSALNHYLWVVHRESRARSFKYNGSKVGARIGPPPQIPVSAGQVVFELGHLREKFRTRAQPVDKDVPTVAASSVCHPLFVIVAGTGLEPWEKG